MKILTQKVDHFQGELVKGVHFKGVQGDRVQVEDEVAAQVMRDFPTWFKVIDPIIPPVIEEEKMVAGSPENKMMKPSRRMVK